VWWQLETKDKCSEGIFFDSEPVFSSALRGVFTKVDEFFWGASSPAYFSSAAELGLKFIPIFYRGAIFLLRAQSTSDEVSAQSLDGGPDQMTIFVKRFSL
jgi:hypothetical protein